MALFGLSICIPVAILIHEYFEYGEIDTEDWVIGFFAMLALVGFSFIISLIISLAIPFEHNYFVAVEERNIYSCKDNRDVSGNFVLGTGHIDETLFYYYIIDTEQGQKIDKVKSDYTYIQSTHNAPKIIEYRATGFKYKVHYLYSFPANYYYVLYVPENTIKYEYNVDME